MGDGNVMEHPSVFRYWMLGLFSSMAFLLPRENTDSAYPQAARILPPFAPINYQQKLTEIAQLQSAVQTAPRDVDARRRLVHTAVIPWRKILLAAGTGKAAPQQSAQLAHRAALLDAYRWAAYILRWRENPTVPDFGSIEATVSGGQVVYTQSLLSGEVQVLLKINLPETR